MTGNPFGWDLPPGVTMQDIDPPVRCRLCDRIIRDDNNLGLCSQCEQAEDQEENTENTCKT